MRLEHLILHQPMLLDRTVITTRFEITPDVVSDRQGFNRRHGTDILEMEPGSRQRDGRDQRTLKLVFGSYGGIVVFAEELTLGRWFANTIHFNARNVLYRHNGHGLSVENALVALTILRDEVYHILEDPDDIIHVLPGLHPDSNAFWSLLEIPIDLPDPDGALEERVFRNPHFPGMGEGFRARDGKVRIGSSGGPLQISFYRKDRQMRRVTRKYGVDDVPRVFRIEVVLSQHKLLQHLGNDRNVERIGEHYRLVRFTPVDLIECLLRIVTLLQGCFRVAGGGQGVPRGDKLGRFMALVAAHHGIPLTDLFALYEMHIGCADRTRGRHRKAARAMMASVSPVVLGEVFSDRNFQHQGSIVIPELEERVEHRLYRICDSDIWAAYGRPLPYPRRTSAA